MIEVRDLLKRHGGTAVLQELNFDVPERALTAIIGPNGAGTSTLLSLVSRLMPITAGKVRVAGLDVATTPTEALARIMAILRQDNQSTLRLTVRDLVGFGRFPHSKGRLGPEDLRHVDEALEYLARQRGPGELLRVSPPWLNAAYWIFLLLVGLGLLAALLIPVNGEPLWRVVHG